MRQAQSAAVRPHAAARWWAVGSGPLDAGSPHATAAGYPVSPARSSDPAAAFTAGWMRYLASAVRVLLAVLRGVWIVATLPIRGVFWLIAWLGRLAAVAMGFSLVAIGMFFLAGPFFLIGIPLFLVGLVLMLRGLDG